MPTVERNSSISETPEIKIELAPVVNFRKICAEYNGENTFFFNLVYVQKIPQFQEFEA